MKKITYLRTITALRGISVLGVLLYHSKYSLFKGGYLGVDVFFVISGFLIANIIFSEIQNFKFSFKEFYLRRLRRLFPSLLFTLIFSILISYLFLLPEDYELFNYSIPYTLFFIGNIFFWNTSDYFSPNTDIMPLSHLWSLSIEEQFYIIFPILIFLFYKNNFLRNKIKQIIYLGIFLSFFYTISGFYNLPLECPSSNCIEVTNFYWLHTRAWELLVGVLLNFISLRNIRYKNLFLHLGFFLILISFMFEQNNFNHPGIGTLPTIFGTSLIILSCKSNDRNFISKSSILYFFGKISYSLYLIHFPIFVVKNYFGFSLKVFQNFDILPMLFIFMSTALSYVMWKNIETPFRDKNFINNKHFLIFSVFFTLIILILSISSILPEKKLNKDYEKFNFSTDFNIKKECFFEDVPETIQDIDECMKPIIGKKNVLIAGSSIAQNIYKGLSSIEQKSINFDLVVVTGCPPLLENYSFDIPNFSENKCKDIYKQVNKNLTQKNYEKIILIYQWDELLDIEINDEELLFDHTFNEILHTTLNNKIYIISQPVKWKTRLDVFAYRELNLKNNINNYNYSNLHDDIFLTEQNLLDKFNELNLSAYSLLNFFCKDKKCQVYQLENNEYFFTSVDFIHISDYFSKLIGLELFNIFDDSNF